MTEVYNHESEQFEEVYRITEQAIMQSVLKDYGIEVSDRMANAIFRDFMEIMEKNDYVEFVEGNRE